MCRDAALQFREQPERVESKYYAGKSAYGWEIENTKLMIHSACGEFSLFNTYTFDNSGKNFLSTT